MPPLVGRPQYGRRCMRQGVSPPPRERLQSWRYCRSRCRGRCGLPDRVVYPANLRRLRSGGIAHYDKLTGFPTYRLLLVRGSDSMAVSIYAARIVAAEPRSITSHTIRNIFSARISIPAIFVKSEEGDSEHSWVWRTPLRSTAPYWTSELSSIHPKQRY